ncbi:MAG: putative metal-binding motif-containing protein [Myxococcota bacterium]
MWLGCLVGCSGEDKTPPEICKNTLDDDADGDADCADSDCAFVCGEICDDGLDNDGDGDADCADLGCTGQCPEVCDDGLDNDGDGVTDCLDVGDCASSCPETCDDAVDNDGDGSTDCVDPDCASTCDADQDTYLTVALGGDDCDDTDPGIHPGADEVCNGLDDDCDAAIDVEDDGLLDGTVYYADDDLDGWGNALSQILACTQPTNTVPTPGDCDDGDGSINPDRPEICSGEDDDCDMLVDEADDSLDLTTLTSWYVDADADGWGVPGTPVEACLAPVGRADNDADCDDTSALAGPAQVWARDVDGDGFGGGEVTPAQCDAPGPDWVGASLGYDCADDNPAISPAAIDVCGDGVDQDCEDGDFLGCFDTAAILGIDGEASVDELSGTYTGTEVYQWVGAPSGWLICEWTWTMLDWDSDPTVSGVDPIAVPCADADGFGCDWSHTVHQSGGTMTDGSDCAFYGLTPATPLGPAFGYGWTEAYRAGGVDYGPTMMYFVAPYALWVGMHPAALFPHVESYDQGTGAFAYTWDEFAVFPTP